MLVSSNVFFVKQTTFSSLRYKPEILYSRNTVVFVIVQDCGFFRESSRFKLISCVVLKSKIHVNRIVR